MASGPITSWQIGGGKGRNSVRSPLLGLQNHCRWWLQPWSRRCLLLGRKALTNLDSVLRSRDISLPTKVCTALCCESWTARKVGALKNWCLWIVVLEKTRESPLGSKEIKPVNLNGNQPWIHVGKTDAETPVPWSSDTNNWLIGKVPNAGEDWGQKEKRT